MGPASRPASLVPSDAPAGSPFAKPIAFLFDRGRPAVGHAIDSHTGGHRSTRGGSFASHAIGGHGAASDGVIRTHDQRNGGPTMTGLGYTRGRLHQHHAGVHRLQRVCWCVQSEAAVARGYAEGLRLGAGPSPTPTYNRQPRQLTPTPVARHRNLFPSLEPDLRSPGHDSAQSVNPGLSRSIRPIPYRYVPDIPPCP